MRHRDVGQALVTGICIQAPGPLHQATGGRPRQGAVQGVGLGEQAHVSRGEFAAEAAHRGAVALGQARVVEPTLHQPRELGSGVTGGALQIAPHHTPIGALQAGIREAFEHRADEGITLAVVCGRTET